MHTAAIVTQVTQCCLPLMQKNRGQTTVSGSELFVALPGYSISGANWKRWSVCDFSQRLDRAT